MSAAEHTPRADLGNVEVEVVVELGRREDMTLGVVRRLQEQDFVELDKLAGEAFTILVNQRPFAEGEIVVVTDIMAVRVTRMLDVPQTQEVLS